MGNYCDKMCFGAGDSGQKGQQYIALTTGTNAGPLLEKDKQYMMEEERWFEKQGKLLMNTEKFIESFPNYVKEQVSTYLFTNVWNGISHFFGNLAKTRKNLERN